MASTKTVSVTTGGTNSANVTAAEINAVRTDFISNGIVGAVTLNTGSGGAGGYAVNAQSSPNMTVRVSAGDAYVLCTPTGGTSQSVRVDSNTFEDVTIAANATGGTRYDYVYIKLDPDKLANPASDKSDIATFVTSRSTSTATDNGTPPTYGYCLGYVTVANAASSITNSNITDQRVQTGLQPAIASVGSVQVVTGVPVQVVSTNYSAVATGTTLIPFDDTIPQTTEGVEYMTQAITPKIATNRLSIEATAYVTCTAVDQVQVALFQDSTVNALAATSSYQLQGTGGMNITLRHDMAAGQATSTTFRIRIGGSTAGTVTFNGASGGRKFGGITISNIKITEYKV